MNILKTTLKPVVTFITENRGQIKNATGLAAALAIFAVISDMTPRVCIRWSARISLTLGAATSWPGVLIISKIMHTIYTDAQLQKAFGRNLNYEGNPLHIRHRASLLSAAFAIPVILDAIVSATHSLINKDREKPYSHSPISDRKMAILVTGLFLVSRPVLHQGSILARRFVAK